MLVADKSSVIVSLAGEITWQTVQRLRERFGLLVAQGHRSIVVNLASVDYIDSSGLATLISLYRRLRAAGGQLMLVNVSERIMRALRQARMSEFIPTMGAQALRHDKIQAAPAETPRMVRTLAVPCDASRMSETRRAVGELLESLDLPRDMVFDLTLALGEALGNAFDHGSGETGEGRVTVTVSLYNDRIVMEVTDCGCGCSFEDGDELPEPTETRGRGIRLMLMLADAISIEPKKSGHGTSVRLVKMIEPSQLAKPA